MIDPKPSPTSLATLLWRAAFASGVALTALLVILLWPAARAVGEALARYGDLVAGVLLAFGVLLLLAVVRIAFALGRRLEAQADQAALAHMPNGHPIHLRDLRQTGLAMMPHGLDRHYDVALAEAQRQFPHLTSFHQVVRIDGAAPALPAAEPAPTLIEPPPGLEEAIRRGLSTPDRWYVGLSEAGQPQQIVLKHTGFIATSGVQGTGKTNLAALIAAQCAAHGGYLFVVDPHNGDDESLSTRLAPCSGAVERFAVTPAEIGGLISKVDKIYQARTRDPRQVDAPVLLIIDEFMDLMVRGQLDPASIQALLALSGTGRKKRIHVLLISQNWSQRLLGQYGVAMRQCVTHALVCRSSQETAQFLLPPGSASGAMTLRPGQALLFGPGGEPALTTAPLLLDTDLHIAARGRPPRPYRPWPALPIAPTPAPVQSSAVPIPPTIPIPIAPPRPAPPTERLEEPTVRQQILYLLAACPWQTSGEIACAIGADLHLIQTELYNLHQKQEVERRPVRRKIAGKFEYAVTQSTQSAQSVITPSA